MTNSDLWQLWLKDLESAEQFINWGWLNLNANALGRSVFMNGVDANDDNAIFPNMFNLFVGPPASGKSRAMRKVWTIMREVKNPDGTKVYNKAANSTTPAALLRKLKSSAYERKMPNDPEPYKFHHMMVMAEELGNLMKTNDKDMANTLLQFYDAYEFDKQTITGDTFDLENICVGMIACTTQDWLGDSMTDSLFGQGFMSRFVVVCENEPRHMKDNVEITPEQNAAKRKLIEHVQALSKLSGRVEFTKDAMEFRRYIIEHPQDNYLKKRPNDSKRLDYYYARKRLHLFKTSMAMHFSESTEMLIDRPVMEKAYNLLGETEKTMHKAFTKLDNGNPYHGPTESMLTIIRQQRQGIPKRKLMQLVHPEIDAERFEKQLNYLVTTKQVEVLAENVVAKGATV